ncbi:MAG: alkaline phosphatase PhoX [Pseudomonadota bacterium]
MNRTAKRAAAGALAIAMAQLTTSAYAGSEPFFTPLTQSSAVASPNHVNELNSPWQVPAGITSTNLVNMAAVEADVNQSIQRVPAGNVSTMFDMLAYDPTGRYIFIPHETPVGAGVTRYDAEAGVSHLLFAGNQTGDRSMPNGETWQYDFGAFDPARFTPNGTVILAEEWSGQGRVIEVMEPMAEPPTDPTAGGASLEEGTDWRVLTSIPRVSHEGIVWSVKYPEKVIYFIDENNSGSIYKMVLANDNDYVGGGQTFVLVVDGYAGDPTQNWDQEGVDGDTRYGPATWVPITGPAGEPIAGITNPYDNSETDSDRPGRVSADAVNGTPYGRPEDATVSALRNGNEVVYITTTSEAAVISIEILGGDKAMVRQFAKEGVTPKNVGFDPTTGTLASPDNLAIDALGNVYIIEDKPNGDDVGGDIWFARDVNNDGVAESLDHFMSLQVDGAESTGMIFNPSVPYKFVIAVQHPDSVDIDRDRDEDGMLDFECAGETPHTCQGDAVWEFDLTNVVPPVCQKGPVSFSRGYRVETCVEDADLNFINVLSRSGKQSSKFQP